MRNLLILGSLLTLGLTACSGGEAPAPETPEAPEAPPEPKAPEVDPRLEVQGPQGKAVKRGASWTNAAISLRCSKRGGEKLHVRRSNLGFRCARSV